MIINIGGTFGSGKSTIVQQIMSCYETIEKCYMNACQFIPGTEKFSLKEIGHDCFSKDIKKPLRVIGSYPSGGCDNLKFGKGSLDVIYKLIKSSHVPNRNIIYEGTIVNSVPKITELCNEGYPMTVIFIALSLEDCIKNILERREKLGIKKPFNTKETIKKYEAIKNRTKKLMRSGVNVYLLDRNETFQYCCLKLGISNRSSSNI